MATREGKTALNERERRVRSRKLNGSAVRALSDRERRIWRDGLLKGAALTEQRVLEVLEQAGLETSRFVERLRLRGVVAEPPESFSVVHPAAQWRSR